jgi:hypothetical protein
MIRYKCNTPWNRFKEVFFYIIKGILIMAFIFALAAIIIGSLYLMVKGHIIGIILMIIIGLLSAYIIGKEYA